LKGGVALLRVQLVRNGLISSFVFLAALMPGVSTPQAQEKSAYKELPNFHHVSEKLYRGAQPKNGGIQRLASLGIKTIISLRKSDEKARVEEAEARSAGLRYFNVPFNRQGRPTDEQVNRVLAIINASENQPVFVHCQQGVDRTGLIIACYRIANDHWSSERAKAEANTYGMHFWEWGMKGYIHDFYKGLSASLTRRCTKGQ
jgi:tyrosine-protein phosphatase SIW14